MRIPFGRAVLVAGGLIFGHSSMARGQTITEAPAGYDGLTNGSIAQAQFDLDAAVFQERKTVDEGLGPIYSGQACSDCHANPVGGGSSQVTNLRAGHFNGISFVEQPGGSLVQDRALDASNQERVLGGNEVRTLRASPVLLGAGFIESIDSNTLLAIANSQPVGMRGQFIQVPVLEAAAGTLRGGRFGWKNQHASVLSMVADELRNQEGITSILAPTENTSNGNVVVDVVPDPEDAPDTGAPNGLDVAAITEFLRATKVPPRDAALAATADAVAGSNIFNAIGCAICHVRSIVTAPAGTVINGGLFVVPPTLGSKRIRPFSDFLLHDVGTGDGIVQNGGASTRNKVRTAPLWGMRTRNRLMHDGATLTRSEAILRHAVEATGVINNYRALTATQQNQLIIFLNSL